MPRRSREPPPMPGNMPPPPKMFWKKLKIVLLTILKASKTSIEIRTLKIRSTKIQILKKKLNRIVILLPKKIAKLILQNLIPKSKKTRNSAQHLVARFQQLNQPVNPESA